ncbi:hypothetical protein GCM10017750_69260 [Streptomyces racemochromogenes]
MHEGGSRPLFEEVEADWRHWEQRGVPGLFDFGMTVTPEEQTLWCSSPDGGPYAA